LSADEVRDTANKEQLAVTIRYVDKEKNIKENFLSFRDVSAAYVSLNFHSWCSFPCGIHNLNQAFSSRMYHQNYVSSSKSVHRTFQLLFSSYEMVLMWSAKSSSKRP
jgi:hypothetical protein